MCDASSAVLHERILYFTLLLFARAGTRVAFMYYGKPRTFYSLR